MTSKTSLISAIAIGTLANQYQYHDPVHSSYQSVLTRAERDERTAKRKQQR